MLTGWSKSKTVTVQAAYITGSLTNFPLTVIITDDAEIGGSALANGFDLRFTLTNDTVLSCYRRSFSITGGLATGIYDMLVPSLTSGVNGELVCQYDNPSAPDVSDSAAVFGAAGAGFAGAWGFGDGVTLDLTDLSGNGNDGTNNGATAAAGIVGGAASFGRGISGNYISCGAGPAITGNFVFGAWVKPPATWINTYPQIVARSGASDSVNGINLYVWDATNPANRKFSIIANIVDWGTDWLTSTTIPVSPNWYRVIGTRSGAVLTFYVNGVSEASKSGSEGTVTYNGSPVVELGTKQASIDNCWEGLADEIFISDSSVSAPWISLDYNQIANQSSVVLWGAEESAARPWLASFLRRKRMAA